MPQINSDIIPDDVGKGFTSALVMEDKEYVNPENFYYELAYTQKAHYLKILFSLNKPPFPLSDLDDFIHKEADKYAKKKIADLLGEKVPSFLFSTLKAENKKFQEKFLREMEFTPEQLSAFFIAAGREYGYTLSSYNTEHVPDRIL